tara:strand:+ start:291 stop:1406 length:1116 start_codon:yes stop_codon:yes gene_type:complete
MSEYLNNIKPLSDWMVSEQEPFILAGPCSAETEDQVMAVAKDLVQHKKVKAFRAGIWKPRTRPNSFEGVGAKGLPWLKRVQEELNLPVAIEVANGQHVEKALEAGIQIIWVGARTTVNPFSVQDIADAVKGVDIPVMVKNPINPDLQLWIGALERLNKAGIEKMVAIHRGFSSYDKRYRYAPHWEIPIQLKTALPNMPMICDPSHICGVRETIPAVAQKALDLDMDGLIVEVHPNPSKAWSDPKQQLLPKDFFQLIDQLQFRRASSESAEFTTRLETLRTLIDQIDAEWITKMGERMKIIEEIGVYKKENDVTILQLERWKEILETRIPFGVSNQLDNSFVERILTVVHDESIRLQNQVMNQNKMEKSEKK